MNINDFIIKFNRFPRKQLAELNNALDPQPFRPERHRFSQPKSKLSLVKINKHKLPIDFFPKKQASSRREVGEKQYFPNQFTEPARLQKAQSQRKHYSPEKTSFFGSQEELGSRSKLRINEGNRFLSRKFQTRQEPKRDIYALEPTRKLNTAAKSYKNDMLDLYPPKYDPQIYQLLSFSSKTQNLRSPIKKAISTKIHENPCLDDPQSTLDYQPMLVKHEMSQPHSKNSCNANNVSLQQNGEIMNITFYNAKSSCFPPINRANGKL